MQDDNEKLNAAHNAFMNRIKEHPDDLPHPGTDTFTVNECKKLGRLEVEGNELKAMCLKKNLSVKRLPVLLDKESFMEYSFIEKSNDEEIVIFNMYIDRGNMFYKKTSDSSYKVLCKLNDRDFFWKILNEIKSKLIL